MRCGRWSGAAALLGVSTGLGACGGTSTQACHQRPQLSSLPAPAAKLAGLLEQAPCAADVRIEYAARDDRGAPLDVLDPISDPAGGYLGVYHRMVPGTRGEASYEVLLAHSADLMQWRRLRVLDSSGASMPALCAVPGAHGFLLAYEKLAGPGDGHVVRVQWYRSRADLLGGQPTAGIDLPRRFSPYNNGTPAFLGVRWGGSPGRSVIKLSFHYELSDGGSPGPDREAVGVLLGFRHWLARRDTAVDALIDQTGLRGSHGDERQFQYGGASWRVYEANPTVAGFGSWHVLLYSPFEHRVFPLRFHLPGGPFATSFGNPIVSVLPAPGGHGQALVTTLFVFSSGAAAREAGELVLYQPL